MIDPNVPLFGDEDWSTPGGTPAPTPSPEPDPAEIGPDDPKEIERERSGFMSLNLRLEKGRLKSSDYFFGTRRYWRCLKPDI